MDFSPLELELLFRAKLYGINGEIIGELASKKRVLIDKEDIPEKIKQAIIAIEDQTHNFLNNQYWVIEKQGVKLKEKK